MINPISLETLNIISISNEFSSIALKINSLFQSLLYIKIFHIPFIILWVISIGVFCTIKFKFVNLSLFKHGLLVLLGKDEKHSNGQITHFQAFFTAISATVGLGTISGVAIAISIGGPGAIFWMVITGLFGMSVKFAEVTLGLKYRTNEERVGGPFQYMKHGLAEIGLPKIGMVVALTYAILLIIAMICGGIPFQANQVAALFNNLFQYDKSFIVPLILSLLVWLVIMGGVKRIAKVATSLAPIMTVLYIIGCILIIFMYRDALPSALYSIVSGLFGKTAIGGGAIGSLIAGVRRSVFANEAGTATAAIAHYATQENEPVRAGCVAMIGPCIDTIIISFLTGIVILVTGFTTQNNNIEGIVLIKSIFSSISPLWGYVIFPFITLSFAFSTIIAYSYYCEVAWVYVFNSRKSIILCHILILILIYISGLSQDVKLISSLGDTLFMCLTIPNAITIYLLSKKVGNQLNSYIQKGLL